MPPTSVRQANVQLGGIRKKTAAKWCIRGAVSTWVFILVLLLRGSYVNLQVVSLNAQVQDPSQKPVETTIRGNKLHGKKRQVAATEAVQPPKHTSPILSSSNEKRSQPDAIIAHAVSFLDCGYSLTEKYKDSMLVLRHSIHQNSWHNVNSTSRYSYRMYAFVNSDPEARCDKYTPWIQRMGYTPLLLPNPINLTAIDNQFFREQIDKTGVTGSSELIKLYLYTLTEHEIACHWDIDVIIKVSRTAFAGGYLVSHHRMLILFSPSFFRPFYSLTAETHGRFV